jgi:hypothetical protein
MKLRHSTHRRTLYVAWLLFEDGRTEIVVRNLSFLEIGNW